MAWQAVYEDLSVFSSEAHSSGDLPLDGLQAVIVDDRAYSGLECCGWGVVDGKEAIIIPRPATTFAEMQATYPAAIIVRGKTTSTRQFHKVEVLTGIWSELNIVPSENWEKDVTGWRVWTEAEVFDSAGLAENEWLDKWKSLPVTDWQGVILYENWKTRRGTDYHQDFSGGDHYVMAPSPYGPVFLNTNDSEAEIETRYPGASVKIGTLLTDEAYRPIRDQIDNSRTFR